MEPAGDDVDLARTGVEGLDAVLGGGLPRDHSYLVQGEHGSGKTTLSLQFCVAGVQQGERVLYVATCESEEDIRGVARSHGWSLDGVEICALDVRDILGEPPEQSVFHPAEIELPKTIDVLLSVIDRVDPQRLVIDSLSEIRLLAGDPRWFRRQMLALRESLTRRRCTTLLCDGEQDPHQPLHSIVHGVIDLQHLSSDYGPDRRRLRVAKLRAHRFLSGFHDSKIHTGGIKVYPRLVAAEHRAGFEAETISSGVPELDALFGGGVDRGTATLLFGPAGTGKSITVSQFAVASAQREEPTAMYIFDERVQTLLGRAKSLGLGLAEHVERGRVEIQQIDPAEVTPGEFSQSVRQAITKRGVRMVILDSLAGYAHAMPAERLLVLHLHELLAFLNQQGVTVLMVMAQHGLAGTLRHSPFDLSYIADTVLLFHSFEYKGELRKAISVYKRRGGAHERALREIRFGSHGILVGETLSQFHGISTGTPRFIGDNLPNVGADDHS
jgi:circadian clock protein KaiC